MIVLAIDPGSEQSAWLLYDCNARRVRRFEKYDNDDLRRNLRVGGDPWSFAKPDHVAVEMIASYGMAVGREVFETCVWIGRFIEAWNGPHTMVYRRDCKMHLCGSCKAKDSNIRQSLIDKFGPGKAAAVGVKKSPGPLFGVSKDVWSALAVAVTWAETKAVAELEVANG